MYRLILLGFLTFCTLLSWAQSKKSVVKNRIRTSTEISSKIENGETIEKKELSSFDGNGNRTDEEVYVNDKLQKKESYKYNKAGEIIEHVVYQTDGSIKKKVTKKYNSSGDVVEEESYNGQGQLKKKEVSAYNAFGEKVSEITYDGTGNLHEKALYKYDGKGLKTERLTYDAEGRLVGKKTYSYTFK